MLHRPSGLRYDLEGAHQTAVRYHPHRVLEKQQQAAKVARIAERERQTTEKRRRCEENERNLERKAAEERAQKAAGRTGGQAPLPTVIYRKRRRFDPKT